MFTPKRPTYQAVIQTKTPDGYKRIASQIPIWEKDDQDNPNAPDIHTAKFTINGTEYTLSAWRT